MSQVVAAPLYEKLGGQKAIEAVVEEFYRRVLDDKELKGFFAKTDMAKQKKHQAAFFAMALGGPNKYAGRPMKKAHEGMKINSGHFDKVAGHLVSTLSWAGVTKDDINEVVSRVAPLKNEIVSA